MLRIRSRLDKLERASRPDTSGVFGVRYLEGPVRVQTYGAEGEEMPLADFRRRYPHGTLIQIVNEPADATPGGASRPPLETGP